MIADFLSRAGIIKEEEAEIYIYGYESIISGIIDFSLALFLGILLNKKMAAAAFFIMFVTTRLYAGGYHADTYLKCKLLFAGIAIIVLMISEITIPMYINLMVIGLFISIVCFLAPIINDKKPLTELDARKYRKISIIQSVVWSAAAVFAYFFKPCISSAIIGTMFFITLLMLAGKYRKEEDSYNENEVDC